MLGLRRKRMLATTSIALFTVFLIYEAIHDGILQTDNVYVISYKSNHKFLPSNIICNTDSSITNNETNFIFHDEENLLNCPFSQNKLWYHERLIKTEDLPLQEYTTDTKKILVWTYNWLQMPK